jgi:hypothetical protein
MSFGQRFIYVGVGGSGQTIGRELEGMLRNQICGPNGNKARLDEGKLPELRAHELPRFIQTIYIDFAESDLASTAASLHADPKIVDATATFIHALPNFSASNQITNQLRTVEDAITKSWLPPRVGDWGTEPTFAPLAVGAGQYPTIGRAALFAMLSDRGPEGLLGQFDVALGRITSSKGDLERYNPGGQVSDKVIILVGGSLSGGTGGGIMYDIIQLITYRASQKLGADVTVVPLVALPKNFDSVLGEAKRRSSRLNAARGLADLGGLIDIQNAPPPTPQKPLRYPHKLSFEVPAGVVKSAFLFDTPVDMKGTPIERSIARFALDLVSDVEAAKTGGVNSASQRYMPLLDKLVNDTGLLQLDHPTFVGRRPFAMAATVEIHDEMREVATRIAEDLYSDYLIDHALAQRAAAGSIQVLRKAFAKQIEMVAPNEARASNVQFSRLLGQVLQARNKREMDQAHLEWQGKLNEFVETKTPNAYFAGAREGMSKTSQILTADPAKLGKIARDVAIANKYPITTVLMVMEAALSDISVGELPYGAPAKADYKNIDELVEIPFPNVFKRVPRTGLEQEFARIQEFKIYSAWREFLGSPAGQPIRNMAKEALERIRQMIKALELKAMSFREERSSRQASLKTAALLSNSPDPQEYYRGIYQRTTDALAETFTVDEKTPGTIARSVIVETQEYALKNWDRQEGGKVEKLPDSIIEAVQRLVHDKLQKKSGLYTSLQSLLDLAEVRRDAATSEDSAVSRLGSLILNKVNTSLVPPVVSAEAETRITVSFPGDDAPKKREWLRHILEQNPLVAPHLERLTFVPRSASDSIAVGISVVGLGLLDVPDGASSVSTWVNAAHSPKGTDRLAWRQRRGFRDSIAFVNEEGRVAMIQRLIAAAYNDRLTPSPADPQDKDSFVTLSLHFGSAQAEPIRVPLQGAFPDKLAQVPDAFLETIAHEYASDRGRAVGQILTELSELVPDGAKTGRLKPASDVSPLFKAFVGRHFKTGNSDAQSELKAIKTRVKEIIEEKRKAGDDEYFGELRLSALKEYEKFWIDDVPAALKRPYNILGHNSLWDICKATFDEVAADDLGGLTGSHLDLKKRA